MSRVLERKMNNAACYDDWKEAAIAHDERNGRTKWKLEEKSRRYDFEAIRYRLDKLQIMRRANDNQGLLFTLNEGIHGNLGGMGRSDLYQQSKFGTKQLIVDYNEEVSSALKHLANPRIKGISIEEKVDFFHRAQLCFGRSALLMSGSGSYLFFHIGVLKALWEQDLIPEVLSGSSGGAIIAAVVGTRSHKKMADIFDPEFLDFEAKITNKLSIFGKNNIDQRELENIIEKIIPDLTFAQAYEVSGIQINISIAPAEKHQKSRLLNAITSPNVMIRESVLASCCIPGVYEPVTLAAKSYEGERVPYLPTRKWVDGSLSDDLPIKRLSRLYGVNHFIVSQTNPLVLPFISAEKNRRGMVSTITQTSIKTVKDWGVAVSHIVQKPLKSDSYLSKMINGYISVVSQTYTGDINILPSSRFLNLTRALSVKSNTEIDELIRDGEKSTWPSLEKIRIQTHISRTLNRIVRDLDKRLFKRDTRNKKLKLVNKA